MNTLLFLLEPLINAVYYLYSKACIYEELNILNSCETIESIINDKLSISRFGDGEMKIIRGHGIGFQKYSPELSSRLQEVLQSNMKKHMVCVLHVIRGDFDFDMYKPSSVLFWKYNMLRTRKNWIKYLSQSATYGDSLFTRFYVDVGDKSYSTKMIGLIKEIWDNRDILIVEGYQSRLGVGNDLFQNAKSIERILCPAKDSYGSYETIIDKTLKYCENKLVLIALGPTASILAYDLSRKGYQAVDIGHVDIEYEWYLMGTDKKTPVKGKYVNECHSDGGEISDQVYSAQIIEVIN